MLWSGLGVCELVSKIRCEVLAIRFISLSPWTILHFSIALWNLFYRFKKRDKCILDTCCSSSKIYFLCTGKDWLKSAIILVTKSYTQVVPFMFQSSCAIAWIQSGCCITWWIWPVMQWKEKSPVWDSSPTSFFWWKLHLDWNLNLENTVFCVYLQGFSQWIFLRNGGGNDLKRRQLNPLPWLTDFTDAWNQPELYGLSYQWIIHILWVNNPTQPNRDVQISVWRL